MKFLILFAIFIILIILIRNNKNILISKNYYTIEETYPFLENINKNRELYLKEIKNIINIDNIDNSKNINWIDWVEKDLYKTHNKNGDWTIFPFYGFGIWHTENCSLCPELTKFIKSIPNLKIALLSRMGPNTILTEHQGWSHHSNYVLRCHFGFIIPDNCFISVGYYDDKKNIKREVKNYKENEWIIFDDSRFHYTGNKSYKDRIVLILDIDRPAGAAKGVADKGETKELIDLINSMKKQFGKAI